MVRFSEAQYGGLVAVHFSSGREPISVTPSSLPLSDDPKVYLQGTLRNAAYACDRRTPQTRQDVVCGVATFLSYLPVPRLRAMSLFDCLLAKTLQSKTDIRSVSCTSIHGDNDWFTARPLMALRFPDGNTASVENPEGAKASLNQWFLF